MSVLPAAATPYIQAVGVQNNIIAESSQEDLEYVDTVQNGLVEDDPSFHTVDHERIEIIIEPPTEEETTVTKM